MYLTYFQKQLEHKITQADEANQTHERFLIHKIYMNITKLNVPISKIPKGRSIPPWKKIITDCALYKFTVKKLYLIAFCNTALATAKEYLEAIGDVYVLR